MLHTKFTLPSFFGCKNELFIDSYFILGICTCDIILCSMYFGCPEDNQHLALTLEFKPNSSSFIKLHEYNNNMIYLCTNLLGFSVFVLETNFSGKAMHLLCFKFVQQLCRIQVINSSNSSSPFALSNYRTGSIGCFCLFLFSCLCAARTCKNEGELYCQSHMLACYSMKFSLFLHIH